MRFADSALAAAGHHVDDADSDADIRAALRGEITYDEAVRRAIAGARCSMETERDVVLRRAREYLVRREQMRTAKVLRDQGQSEDDIASALQVDAVRARRLLKSIELNGGDLAVSPREQIYRVTIEGGDRSALVEWLSSYPHTFTEYAPAPFDGSIPGTWTQVCVALLTGLLSQEEYDQIAARVRPPALA